MQNLISKNAYVAKREISLKSGMQESVKFIKK